MTSQSQELSNEQVVEFLKVESEKLAKTGFAPALVLDAIGAFGNYGSIDSLVTPIAAVGGMAGYYGGRNHLVDGPVLAGVAYGVGKLGALVLDHLKDGKINEAQPDALKYLAAYALAALAGKSVQYVKDNWETKTKPALVVAGRGAGTATYATGRGIRDATYAAGRGINYLESGIRNLASKIPLVGRLFKKE